MKLFLFPKQRTLSVILMFLLMTAGLTFANAQGFSGALNGQFSVADNMSVFFSQGNLQYQASTNTWRFASNQYDYMGSGNSNISSTNSGWIDLFGWGTSGYDHGAVCYQPWSTSTTNEDYKVYGNISYNLNDQTGKADWGYNAILNGGNQENSGWRTLTHDEWAYLLNTRSTTSNIRYAKAQVDNVNGLILLPDDWQSSFYALTGTNTDNVSFSTNTISASDWATLEQHGAVFLPAAGARNGTSVNNPGIVGYYSSASSNGTGSAYNLVFHEGRLDASDLSGRHYGLSVRLVLSAVSYSINAIPNHAGGGLVSGAGTFYVGAVCTLTATASEGFTFVNWTENGEVVSTDAEYTFTVTGNRDLVAHFGLNYLQGIVYGAFSVGNGQQVFFSQGNLQYIGSASTPYWKFADHQWDYLGTTTGQNSSDQDVDRDLFGWGTSGYNHGATCYQPWSVSTSYGDYYAYGGNYNLYDQTGQADWGYNAIANGNNLESSGWRTLTRDEWSYLFNTRSTTSNIRYAKAQVDNVNGVILLPDNWSADYYTLSNANTSDVGFDSNTISASDWTTLEQHGAVFLPAAGYRNNGTSVDNVGAYGLYWSASVSTSMTYTAYYMLFNGSGIKTDHNLQLQFGLAVRLARPYYQSYSFINVLPSPTECGTVSGAGAYLVGITSTVTATALAGYTFVNWTEDGTVVSTDAEYTFTVTGDRTLVANFSPSTYNVTLNTNGGTINSGYVTSYTFGVGATLPTDVTRTGYTFEGWYDNSGLSGSAVLAISTTATGDKAFWAKWTVNSYAISVTANPADCGTITGAGSYDYATTCTLTATASTGYTFAYWTENGEVVSTDAEYTFTVTDDRDLVANFTHKGSMGNLIGQFTVGENAVVFFSQGNLQYIGSASTPYWKFADQQWDYLGVNTGQNSSNQNVDRDHFGWGTSGYNHGAVCYQPWSTSNNNSDYYAYGSDSYNLYDQTGQADWGYNAIVNGGNQVNSGWRTLTKDEWTYLFNTRSTNSNIRYAKAQVNNVNGVILLPDDWQASYYALSGTNTPNANYSTNTITAMQWTALEQHGAVFLPAAGYRAGTLFRFVGSYGYYWSASNSNSDFALQMYFTDGNLISIDRCGRVCGHSVRLVHLAESYSINATPNPADGGSVSGTGIYQWSTKCTLTATASEGFTFVNWTENGEEVSTDAEYTFTVMGGRDLVAHFRLSSLQGILHGAFSVNNDQQVFFSQGNLQYIGSASTPYWKFADHQWDYFGTTTDQNSSDQNVDRDLFGWGTSGYDHGAVCYQPWSTSNDNSDYYAYGSQNYNLNDQTGQADWGYNAIANGGNQVNSGWRTLTKDEWMYVLNFRTTASGIRYAKAQVNNVNGLILLPDNWQVSNFALSSTNTSNANFSSNTITASQWMTLEQYGAVFLPAVGFRNGTSIIFLGSKGYYWSASNFSGYDACFVRFDDENAGANYSTTRDTGCSVRLVRFAQNYSINATSNPTECGSVSGTGTYLVGTGCTLTATASAGYIFESWTENGTVVSTDAEYTFTVTGGRDLVAQFRPGSLQGIVNGAFSVNNVQQVFFSQGNLQYIGSASTPYWKFADHQWDYLGATPGQQSRDQNANRDLFGWGTSGYNHGAECYQPWNTIISNYYYLAYGNMIYNLNDQTGQADWGYNAILNGGNHENSGWRTLTHDEWEYLFNTRSTTSNIRYAKAQVDNVNGVILLPDDWNADYYTLSGPNNADVGYGTNTITTSQWTTLEQHGAVFLPAAGVRDVTSVNNAGSVGFYSSASTNDTELAYDLVIRDESLNASDLSGRHYGLSVRLVIPAEHYSFVTTTPNPTEGGTVSGASNYHLGAACTLTATASAGYTFAYWTENGEVVSTDAEYTFTVTDNRDLVANFTQKGSMGNLNGQFTIGENAVVFFSQGNLQYIGSASTPYWKFADQQWGHIGVNTGQNSSDQNVDRDLFGWGTSGYNHGAVCYQPWSTSTNNNDYSVYGRKSYNLNDCTGQADWGYNAIFNGGNQENIGWRTLTHDEWEYLFNTRVTTSNIRYAKAQVACVDGVILLPDDWSADYYMLNNTDAVGVSFDSNTITASQWTTLERHGAVFLPAAGVRNGTTVNNLGSVGFYSSASSDGSDLAYDLVISDGNLNASDLSGRHYGLSVRLVLPVENYSINAIPSPAEGGSVSGVGTYLVGTGCTLTATTSAGYTFESWTENGAVVSTDAEYTFIVTGDRNLVAQFQPCSLQGIVNGVFSVNNGQQVFFSQGNLQYIGSASTPYWKFADHQWDYLGITTGQNSSNQNADRDLFGWGTSGYNHGAVCYYPWSTSTNNYNYFVYGKKSYNLNDQTGKADWGYNAILNGGNHENSGWRTLTHDEWEYLLNTRITTSNIRYAKAQVDNVNGVILLPDNWSADYYTLSNPNTGDAGFNSNTISASDWAILERHGAVFLPAAGVRNVTSVNNAGSVGFYSSASSDGSDLAYDLVIRDESLNASDLSGRHYGLSVRLVIPAERYSIVTTISNPTEGGTVSGAGNYHLGATCTLTATASAGYSFAYWMENGEVVATDAEYTFTVTENRDLVANFTQRGSVGNLNGQFTVGENAVTFFSQGNLQYVGSASTPYWKFADLQWEYLGATTGQDGSNQNVDRDLFGWGTSGYNHGAVCYYPWSTSTNESDYYAYGSDTYNLYDQTGKADWGYNAISNGGNQENIGWRVLTINEWDYVFNTRSTTSGIRYAKAQVNNVNGVILLPDDWESSYYALSGTNTDNVSFSTNTITATQWVALEQHGAVFLPTAGYRDGTSTYGVGSEGYYWSASCGDEDGASSVYLLDESIGAYENDDRYYGQSVRLVRLVENYSINATSNPAEGGTVSGTGSYQWGAECTLTATASANYTFESWTEDGTVVSTDAEYTFTVTGDRNLVAQFRPSSLQGIVNGVFSVNNGQQVFFSQGNLQYIGSASTPYWKFADHQWDYIGATTGQQSNNQNVNRDLFGWGTSGYNHGAVCYQPWSISDNSSNYSAYGYISYNLNDQTGKADWGYNAIVNGGNQVNSGWRTLTRAEWEYLFNTRSTTSNLRYAKAQVNGVNGVILLPDDWSADYYMLSNANTSDAGFGSNIISASDWATLEERGAVFLSAAGSRKVTTVNSPGSIGFYWSASFCGGSNAYDLVIKDQTLSASDNSGRYYGLSVRLVFPAEHYSFVAATPSPTEGGSVSGAGNYHLGAECTLMATASANYTFVNWTENGEVVSTDAEYTFTVTGDRTLVANFTPIIYSQEVSFAEGWNWWAPTVQCTLSQLETALGTNGLTIKAKDATATYINGQWSGTLTELALGQMYRIETSGTCTFTLNGTRPASVTLTLDSGLNWFGCTSTGTLTLANAFANFTPTEGDKVISQDEGFAIYNGTTWEGTLTTLQPGHGYVYVSQGSTAQTAIFGAPSK